MKNILAALNGKELGNQYCFYWRNERFVAELMYSGAVDYGWRDLLIVRQANNMYKNTFNLRELTGGQYDVDNNEIRYYDNNIMKKVTDFSKLINTITSWINFMMGDVPEDEANESSKLPEFNAREMILIGMDQIILHLNNEECCESWLMCGVPDGADTEEVCAMANDDKDFKYCASLFLDIIHKKSAYLDGLYISKELGVITSESRKEND